MSFFLKKLDLIVKIPLNMATVLNKDKNLKSFINNYYLNYVFEDGNTFLFVKEVLEIKNNFINEDLNYLILNVLVEVITFNLVLNEVVVGIIETINETGLSLNCGSVNVFIHKSQLPSTDYVFHREYGEYYIPQTKKVLKKGSVVRTTIVEKSVKKSFIEKVPLYKGSLKNLISK